MKTVSKRQWFFIHLQCFLVGSLVESSPLSSTTHFLSVTSKVGNQAVLPCSWKQRLGAAAPPACHIQWTTPADTVFEQRGEEKWQAEEFEGRVEVPEEKLGSGDCSLIITDVQIGDTGRYESFMVVDGVRSTKTRVFIQSVKLSVFDHKSLQSRGQGGDLVLDLYTRHSMRVVFQGRNSSEWSDVWMRGDKNSERLQKHLLNEQLAIKMLKSSDEGTYKVLDQNGLAVSTVQLSVEDSTALKITQTLENQVPTDDAAKSSCSALLIFSVLSFQILHLL
ncbi:galectin 17 isoform X1 [Sebastes umbrosus]|uniref:galectin 17 isoform X1 n=1 Tax=Sebastes umbrosus TaxID=72105 RepID=UPI00189C5B11|nr:galectin 17 isoform X1 [Sebastes umbrosus]